MAGRRVFWLVRWLAVLLATLSRWRECATQALIREAVAENHLCSKTLSIDRTQPEVWILTALDSAEGDLQAVLDCVPVGGTLRFQGSQGSKWKGVFQPNGTVVIKQPIKLDSASGDAILSCPNSRVPLFEIRSHGVSIENLIIQDCNLTEPSRSAVVIDVDPWAIQLPLKKTSPPEITFSNVIFRRNVNLNSTGGLLIRSVKRASLVNVSFVENRGGYGGGMQVLAGDSQVKLEGCSFEGNLGLGKGGGLSFEAGGGLRILGGRFWNNSAGSNGGGAHLEGAQGSSISIVGTKFESNTAGGGRGGALSVMGTGLVLRVKWARFLRNAADLDGGGISLDEAEGSVEIENTLFERNAASRGGGINAVASGPLSVNVTESIFQENQAKSQRRPAKQQEASKGVAPIIAKGGAVQIDGKELELKLNEVSFLKNQASGGDLSEGGAVSIADVATFEIRGSNFAGNWVDGESSKGGAISMSIWNAAKSTVAIEKSLFANNSAWHLGGAVHLLAKQAIVVVDMKGNSKFFGNSVNKGHGGAIALVGGAKAAGNALAFGKNEAGANGGALWVKGRNTKLKFTNTSFASNEAGGLGGAIHLVSGPTLGLHTGTELIKNKAKQHGGGIAISGAGNITGTAVAFRGNNGVHGGGALFAKSDLSEARISFKSCSFVANNGGQQASGTPDPMSAGKGGAILLAGKGVRMSGSYLLFNENVAREGGAIRLIDAGSVRITDAQFAKNSALSGGGIHVSYSKKNPQQHLTLRDVRITQSSALMGGGLMGDAKTLEEAFVPRDGVLSTIFGTGASPPKQIIMQRVGLWGNVVTGPGGGMHLIDIGAECHDCTFSRNAGGLGGAVALSDSAALDVRKSSFSGNEALSGGAVSIRNSFFDGEEVVATENIASRKGGAMSVAVDGSILGSVPPPKPSLSLRRSTLSLNTGLVGGGIHLLADEESIADDCSPTKVADATHNWNGDDKFVGGIVDASLTACRTARHPNVIVATGSPERNNDIRLVLDQTVITGNTGTEAGGGVWLNRPESLCVCCATVCSNNCPELGSDGKNLRSATSLTDVLFEGCPQIWSNNSVQPGGYGGTIASIGKSTRILDAQNSTIRLIRGHNSGDVLPSVTVTISDAFDQVVTKLEKEAFVRVTSRDGIALGQLDKQLEDGRAHFNSTRVAAPPGEYSLVVELPLGLPSRSLSIRVRECIRGEAAVQGDRFRDYRCDECRPGFFNFQPGSNCTACPDQEKAECNGMSLVPRDGFWHPTSWSTSVKQCLVEDACTYVDRVATLQRESIGLDRPLTFEEGYSLCAEGYGGPLCGSCEAGYGRVHDFECSECPKRRTTLLLVALVCLWLVVAVSFLIRDTLAMGDPTPPSRNARSQAILPFPTGTSSLRRQLGTEARTAASPIERGESGNLTSTDISLDAIMQVYDGEGGQNPRSSNNNSNNRDGIGKRQARNLTRRWGASAALEEAKILINYLQVSAVALAMNVPWRMELRKLLATQGTMSGFSMGSGFFSLDCAFRGTTVAPSLQKSIFVVLFPIVLTAIFSLSWLLRGGIKGKELPYTARRVLVSALVVFYFFYAGMTKQILRILNRVDIETYKINGSDSIEAIAEQFWAEDTRIPYFSGQHAILAGTLGVPMLLLFTIGYPLGLFLLLKGNRDRLSDQRFASCYGFLYRAYSSKLIYWELVVMLRKFLLVFVVVFSYPLGGNIQGILAVTILVVAMVFHTLCSPYCEEFTRMNRHETLSLCGSVLTFLVGLTLNDKTIPSSARIATSLLLIACTVCTVGFFVWCLAVEGIKFLDRILEEAGLQASSSNLNVLDRFVLLGKLWRVRIVESFAREDECIGPNLVIG